MLSVSLGVSTSYTGSLCLVELSAFLLCPCKLVPLFFLVLRLFAHFVKSHRFLLLPYIHTGNNWGLVALWVGGALPPNVGCTYTVKGCLLSILSTCGVGLAQYPGGIAGRVWHLASLGWMGIIGWDVLGAHGWHIKGPQPGGALASLVSVSSLGPQDMLMLCGGLGSVVAGRLPTLLPPKLLLFTIILPVLSVHSPLLPSLVTLHTQTN